MSFQRICAHCQQQPVRSRRSDAIYCSPACKVAACRARKAFAAHARQETSQKPIEMAIARLRPGARRVLRSLEAAPRHSATTNQLRDARVGGHRFSSYIYEIRTELRHLGISIDDCRLRNGQHEYTLRLPQLQLRVDVPTAPASQDVAAPSSLPAASLSSGRGGDVDTGRKAAA